MSSSLVDRDAVIAEKITNVWEQDLKHYTSKVYDVSSVLEPKEINAFIMFVKDKLTSTVCALDEGLNDLIMTIRNREATASGTVAANSAAARIDTPLGDLFGSTLIAQASKISASMASVNLEFPMVKKNFPAQLSCQDFQLGLIRDIIRFNEFYRKKIKVFFIDMEEDLKKILSGISVEGKEDFSREEGKVDFVLNSKPLVDTIMVQMKTNDILEDFWKQFIDKYFSGKVSSASTESNTRLNKESEFEVSSYINAYAEWKYTVNEYLINDIEQVVSDFVEIIAVGDTARENETFSSSALICIEHFDKLRRKIVEESSRPEKDIESEIGQFIELADSNEQRVKGRVLKEEALESCKALMRSQREDMIKYVNKQQKSILTKGFTLENLRKYSSQENV